MEYKLIMAVSGFPSLYDSGSLTYRDLNMRSEAWRRVAEVVGVPESECRRKWKTLRDQHRRERQRERERRESGIGLFNYRPWRYSAILSFLNPFIDARAAGTNGWALDPQPPLVGCSTTTELRSDDDDNYGIAVADATTTTASSSSSSSYSEFVQRKRPSPGSEDAIRLKEAKTETASDAADVDADDANAAVAIAAAQSQQAQHAQMKELLEMMMHSVTSLASCLASSHSASSSSQLLDQSALLQNPSRLKTEEQEVVMSEFLDQTDDEDDVDDSVEDVTECPRPPRAKRKSSSGGGGDSNGLLEEFLRRMETRDAQRNLDLDQRDDVTLFLLSLAPAMRRLSSEKQSWIRTRIQQLLHEAQFGATSFN